MSTKLYNGYRIVFPDGIDILYWQDELARLRDELVANSEVKLRQDFNRRAVYALDRDTLGLLRPHDDKSPLGAAYKAMDADCDEVRRGHRHPTFDTEVNLCWRAIDRQTVLCILYAEMREYRDRVVEYLDLEDYHYQNQSDPPDGCTWEEMQARGEVWEKAFGTWNNAPIARFHTFTLCDAPKGVPGTFDVPETPQYHKGIPMEDRAKAIAFDLLWSENWETAPGNTQTSKVLYVERESREGGSLHARLLELREEVQGKLLVEPTWEDYRRKPAPPEEAP